MRPPDRDAVCGRPARRARIAAYHPQLLRADLGYSVGSDQLVIRKHFHAFRAARSAGRRFARPSCKELRISALFLYILHNSKINNLKETYVAFSAAGVYNVSIK